MAKEKITIIPHPNKVLIKISKEAHEKMFFKLVKNAEGKKVKLFSNLPEDEGMEKKFTQNVSCGEILAVGTNVKDIFPTDIAIIDYLVSNSPDNVVGYVNGDIIVALDAVTTYHEKSAPPAINMRRAYVKGDFDELSKILGVVRGDRLVSFSPYVFLSRESEVSVMVGEGGVMYEEQKPVVERTVLSAFVGSGFKDGETVIIKEADLFFRHIGDKEISVCFYKEILATK